MVIYQVPSFITSVAIGEGVSLSCDIGHDYHAMGVALINDSGILFNYERGDITGLCRFCEEGVIAFSYGEHGLKFFPDIKSSLIKKSVASILDFARKDILDNPPAYHYVSRWAVLGGRIYLIAGMGDSGKDRVYGCNENFEAFRLDDELPRIFYYPYKDTGLFFDMDGKNFVSLDANLNPVWKVFCDSLDRKAIEILGLFALYLGHQKSADRGEFGTLVVVDPETGKEVWRIECPFHVQSLRTYDNFLYVSANGSGYVYDGATGKELVALENIFTTKDKHTELVGDGRYLVFTHAGCQDNVLYREIAIFCHKTGERLRHMELPKGWVPRMISGVFAQDGKFYIPLVADALVGDGGGLLVIDSNDIDAPLRFDCDITFEKKLVKLDKDIECQIHVSWPNVQDILRYAPRVLREIGVSEGRSNMFGRKVKKREFNGKVHLMVDGEAASLDEKARESLDIMIASVNSWWSQWGFYASDGKRLLSADWQVQ